MISVSAKDKLKICVWIAFAGVTALIFILSAQHAEESSALSKNVLSQIMGDIVYEAKNSPDRVQFAKVVRYHHYIRKTAHFMIYALWGALLSFQLVLYRFKTGSRVVITLIAGFVYAASDELHQAFVPDRSGQISDVFLDTAGVAVGILFVGVALWVYKNKLNKKNN